MILRIRISRCLSTRGIRASTDQDACTADAVGWPHGRAMMTDRTRIDTEVLPPACRTTSQDFNKAWLCLAPCLTWRAMLTGCHVQIGIERAGRGSAIAHTRSGKSC
eukprot:1418144-Rhodomonas_salina.2